MDWIDMVGAFCIGSLFGMWLERTYLKLKAKKNFYEGRY